MTKTLIITGLIIGSIIGGYIPLLWGGSTFSMSSIIWSGLGALAGIFVGYKIARRFE